MHKAFCPHLFSKRFGSYCWNKFTGLPSSFWWNHLIISLPVYLGIVLHLLHKIEQHLQGQYNWRLYCIFECLAFFLNMKERWGWVSVTYNKPRELQKSTTFATPPNLIVIHQILALLQSFWNVNDDNDCGTWTTTTIAEITTTPHTCGNDHITATTTMGPLTPRVTSRR